MAPSRNDIRNDIHTVACPVCATTFTPTRRQRYCTPACRQAAWRARHPPPQTGHRRAGPHPATYITVYQCPGCDTRYLGQQYCHDCHQPCERVDYGGLCPHRNEPITISDILDQHPAPPTSP
jgi:hypothetical protein